MDKRPAVLREKAKALLGKGGAVWLVILAGLALLLLPGRKEGRVEEEICAEESTLMDTAKLEERLSQLLSQVEGAGQVEVLLSPAAGQSKILARDEEVRERNEGTETASETVVVSRGSEGEETVTLQLCAEEYRGAVVVAEGGEDPAVVLALTRAVSAVTGLGADRITVMKMVRS